MLKLIEIFCAKLLSPSVRRAWIEMTWNLWRLRLQRSPSVRRAWIEISVRSSDSSAGEVTLREEGVD